jgi:hypothetical protein
VTGSDPRRNLGRSISDSTFVALAILVACGAMYLLVARLALRAFPYSGDEYSLFLQAELFARGMLKAPAPEHASWFRVDHVIIDRWVRSKYPPGAPALLALGARGGVAWIVTPIEGLIALFVVWLTTRRLLGARPALIALLTLGLAPLFAFQAASFYSHTAATMFLAIAFAGIAAWSRHKRPAWMLLAGAAIGCAYLIRPIDAILFGLAMISLRSGQAVVIAALSALPFVLLNFAYQNAQFGSPFLDGYHVYQPTFAALYGSTAAANPILLSFLWNPVQLWNHIDIYRAFVVDWTVPGTALVALVGAFTIGRDHPARPLRTFSVGLIGTYAVALLLTIADVDDGARPRYLSIVLIPVAFLTAAGFGPTCAALAARFGPRVRTSIVAIALVFAPAQLAAYLVAHVPQVWRREGLFRTVERAALRDAIVVVRAANPSRYARNGGLFDRAVLYLSAPAATSGETIATAFPGRAVWEAHEGEPWTLTRTR